ncbi:hypothetical protein Pyn_20585 [Prunus yedoensis var. nudiflora]|uniref:Uncharacterized protein n=1 Tax=Prunus yedoensis var. nudiflora TaxID=2094558 RepID=A0A314UY16_PRUYE|nr:hypothetical protein Pyn_20585 [Prunus yedoensis var. nudiflora]
MPVNSCTIARKLDVSVVSTVVGALLEALVLFLEFRVCAAADEDEARLVLGGGEGGGLGIGWWSWVGWILGRHEIGFEELDWGI